MKASKYNFFFPFEDEKQLAYNALSNSMALMDRDSFEKYMEFETNGIAIDDIKLVESLQKGSFLLEDTLDELEMIRHDMYASRFGCRVLGLTIAVTSDCNFKCVYCYEKGVLDRQYMDLTTEGNICRFIQENYNLFDCLDVTWYGGEPLMNVGTIERLSNFFIKLCGEKNIKYYASIVTNGYNLTKDNLELLKSCYVTKLQITIDGSKEIHNSRRPLQNGKGTYDRIMDNLSALKDELIPVSLRINTDKENCFCLEDVLKELQKRKLTSVVTPYIAKVEKGTSVNENEIGLSMKEFLIYRDNFATLMGQYGYLISDRENYPTRVNSFCGCDKVNTYVIGVDGAVYKCWQSIGNKGECIGNINGELKERNNAFYYKCMMSDPSMDEECRECKYLPICMGGCPKRRKVDKKQICEETRYNFEKRLKKVALEIIELRKQKE